jgi:hypothetical protein
MRVNRLSIAGLMGVILIVALGLVGLKEGTEFWAGAIFVLTTLLLLGSILNAIHGRGALRAGWIGFALFGWAYAIFVFGGWSSEQNRTPAPPPPTSWPLDRLDERIHVKPEYVSNPALAGSAPMAFSPVFPMPPRFILKPGTTPWLGSDVHYRQVGHCLATILFGTIGAAWSRLAYRVRTRAERPSGPEEASPEP